MAGGGQPAHGAKYNRGLPKGGGNEQSLAPCWGNVNGTGSQGPRYCAFEVEVRFWLPSWLKLLFPCGGPGCVKLVAQNSRGVCHGLSPEDEEKRTDGRKGQCRRAAWTLHIETFSRFFSLAFWPALFSLLLPTAWLATGVWQFSQLGRWVR